MFSEVTQSMPEEGEKMDPAIKILQTRLKNSEQCSERYEQEVTELLQRIEGLLAEMDNELVLQQSLREAISELRGGHKSPELQA